MKASRVGWAALVGSLCAVVALCSWPARDTEHRTREFTSHAWAEGAPGRQFGLRELMLPDLFARHLRVGMGRNELLALLGPPDYEQEEDDGLHSGWRTRVSPWHPMISDAEALVVRWGSDGLVARVSASDLPALGVGGAALD